MVVAGCTKPTDEQAGEWVDLGLPSGLLWASHNVGASVPEEYGNYFAWGEVQPKEVYGLNNYRYYSEVIDDNTKYTGSDGLLVLQSSDDAATANMGDTVRIPTKAEWEELIKYTTGKMITQKGVYGHQLTGRNGKSIFLPAGGFRWDMEMDGVSAYGKYWSSTLDRNYPNNAFCYYFDYYYNADGIEDNTELRYYGLMVRPVRSAR